MEHSELSMSFAMFSLVMSIKKTCQKEFKNQDFSKYKKPQQIIITCFQPAPIITGVSAQVNKVIAIRQCLRELKVFYSKLSITVYIIIYAI